MHECHDMFFLHMPNRYSPNSHKILIKVPNLVLCLKQDEEEDGAEFNMSDIARLSRKPAKKDKEGKQGARGFVVPEK